MTKLLTEEWRTIYEFPNYEISSRGNIFNIPRRQYMRTSCTRYGHTKITLTDYDGARYTRSVPLLVANAFVPQPNFMCDYLMTLDGDLSNVESSNLAWRPRGFAFKYTRQLKLPQPQHFVNLPVRNVVTGVVYDSIIEAGVAEGLLFENIWRSTYTGFEVFPHGSVFEVC